MHTHSLDFDVGEVKNMNADAQNRKYIFRKQGRYS